MSAALFDDFREPGTSEKTAHENATPTALSSECTECGKPLGNQPERLRSSGAGISTRLFLEHGILPTLRTLGTSRAELKTALRRRASTADIALTTPGWLPATSSLGK
jgi:hypothetical protein